LRWRSRAPRTLQLADLTRATGATGFLTSLAPETASQRAIARSPHSGHRRRAMKEAIAESQRCERCHQPSSLRICGHCSPAFYQGKAIPEAPAVPRQARLPDGAS
jgi:hypothetical protein